MNTSGPLIINLDGVTLSKDEAKLLENDIIGSVILFSHNYNNIEQIATLINDIKKIRENILISVDHEGGRVQRFKNDFTILPSFGEIGHLYKDKDFAQHMSYSCGFVAGYELSKIGVDINFSPVVDLNHFSGKLLNDRCFGNEVEMVRLLALAYVEGSINAKILPVMKHFPGHGITDEDTHSNLITSDLALEHIINNDLVPFIDIYKKYPIPIMTSHIKFPKVDKEVVTYSQKWLTNISKKIFSKKVCFISDDIEMEGAKNNDTLSKRVIDALNAGCNMVIATTMLKQNVIKSNESSKYFKKYYLTQELIDYCKDFCNDEIMQKIDHSYFADYGDEAKYSKNVDEEYKTHLKFINAYKS